MTVSAEGKAVPTFTHSLWFSREEKMLSNTDLKPGK